MENKNDLPNWNRFLKDVLADKYRESKEEKRNAESKKNEKAQGKG